GPFFGFVGYELAKVGGRADKWCASEVSQPRLDFGIGEARVDLLVELVDDLGWRGLGCADAEPIACLVPRQELPHARDVRQGLRTRSVVTASARSLPALIYSIGETMVTNMTCT